jgi:hypothetical protein
MAEGDEMIKRVLRLSPAGHGCLKLGLVHAGAGLREVFPLLSAELEILAS